MLGDVVVAVVASVREVLHLPEDLPVQPHPWCGKPDLPPGMDVVLLSAGALLPFSIIFYLLFIPLYLLTIRFSEEP